MKQIVLLVTCCLLANGFCNAQSQQDLAILNEGPLIATKLPTNIKWQVAYKYSDAAKSGEVSDKDKQLAELAAKDPEVAKLLKNSKSGKTLFSSNQTRPLLATITVTGTLRHEEQVLENNQSHERWINGNFCVEQLPNVKNLSVRMDDFSEQNNFPGFSWIKKSNFSGIQKSHGTNCLIFKERLFPMQVSNPELFDAKEFHGEEGRVDCTAYIDAETRYPVALTFGVESREYTYFSTPSAPLVVPTEFQAAINEARTH